MAKKDVILGLFSTSGNATATRLLPLCPCNFLSTCRYVCDKSSRSSIVPDVAGALRRYVLEVKKTPFSLKTHVFAIISTTSPIQLSDVVAFDSARHFTSERLGPHLYKESTFLKSILQKKYRVYIKCDFCTRKAMKNYVGYTRSESQFDSI